MIWIHERKCLNLKKESTFSSPKYLNMRHTKNLLILAFLLNLGLTGLSAQDSDIPIAILVYMNAPDGAEYVDMEREIWMPVHSQRIREGKLLNWQLYQVVRSTGDNQDYNYLIVETYPNWQATEEPYADIGKMIEEVHGSTSIDYLSERTENARTMVKQEMWTWQAGTEGEFKMSDVKYIVVDWMDIHPGQFSDYLDMEREYYMPVHQKRVDAGNILGWGLWTKLGFSELPGSIDAATTANFASYNDMWNSYPDDAWESTHPGVDEDDVYERMRETRLMTGSTVLKLIDSVNTETANND